MRISDVRSQEMAVKNILALRGSFITGNYPFIAVHLLQSRGHVKPLALKNETVTPATNHLKLGRPLDEGLLRKATQGASF